MDRGFNLYQNRSNFRGANFGGVRNDRRYDDMYMARGRVGGPAPNYNSGGRYNQNKSWNARRGGGGGGPPRTGDKRRSDSGPKSKPPYTKKKATSPTPPKKDKEEKEIEIVIPDIPDDEVVVPDSLMDSVETLRQRKEIERNATDEDVQKLVVFCYTGKGYQCKSCGLLLTNKSTFVGHLTGKNHVMNVIDARTAKKYQDVRDILDIDLTPDDWFEKNERARDIIMKQSKIHMKIERERKAREEANYDKMPNNFFNFNMELRKLLIKKDKKVVITSLVESTVKVKDFTGKRFFGCEFVRAVTGFHCKLCSINIREAKGVMPHISSRQHKNNYTAYVKKNPEHEKSQVTQSKELFEIMSEHDGKSIVLAESTDTEKSRFLSVLDGDLVRIPTVMDPELKKQKEMEEKEQKEKEEKEQKEKEEKEQKETEEKEQKEKEEKEQKEEEKKEEEKEEEEGNKEEKEEEEKEEEVAAEKKNESQVDGAETKEAGDNGCDKTAKVTEENTD